MFFLLFHHVKGRPQQPLPPRPPVQPQPGISLLPSRPRIPPPRQRIPLLTPQLRPPPRPALPGSAVVPLLPGTTGIILETGEAGPPGTVLMSGRGRLRSADGQAGQSTMPIAEGYAGAPGERERQNAGASLLTEGSGCVRSCWRGDTEICCASPAPFRPFVDTH